MVSKPMVGQAITCCFCAAAGYGNMANAEMEKEKNDDKPSKLLRK